MRAEAKQIERSSPAWRIISLVARHRETTIAELVSELGVTTTAVRLQVNRLHARGWLLRSKRREGPGRPADVYSLSDEGRKLFARNVDVFARLLMEELTEIDGPDKLNAVLARVQRRIGDAIEERLEGDAPGERVERLAELLRQEGTLADATRAEGEVRLSVFTCPYHGVVEDAPQLCEMERDTISRLTGGNVELGRRLVDGQHCCEFKVSLDSIDREPGRRLNGDARKRPS